MEKVISRKNLLLIVLSLVILTILLLTVGMVDATTGLDYNIGNDEYSVSDNGVITNSVNRIWGTVRLVLQVAAISIFLFSGVRYMFASADQKADLKKSMGNLAIGSIFVFGATLIIQFVIKITTEIF